MPTITTFGTLKSEILALIGREPALPVYQLVTADINHKLRLKVMEATSTLTGAAEITLPADFLAVVSVYLDQTPRIALRPTTAQALHETYQSAGTPQEFAIIDGKMLINPVGTGDIELRYIARQDELSADEDVNDIITYYPDIYLYGSLYHHSNLTRNVEAAADYGAAYGAALKNAITTDARDRTAGQSFIPTVGGMMP